ncbi:hypothetical protein [Salegentibacter maritimus]|uniref:hypothetical protein n=1 Tax=Salegentibacter maritimus TaxID=2794347 RepID=UPI0018E4C689|nr:hypothetical protein [Salegentibacter maritimus]MBI6117593.1 hypothetical protein [Salegentibacter maritimus]
MKKLLFLISFILVFTNYKNDQNSSSYPEAEKSYYSNNSNSELYYSDDEDVDYDEGFEDGNYTATVDYYNSETGYNATYTLDVEVEDNEVTVIYFNNGGYLDEEHVWSEELDENGYAEIEGENGKYYEVQIDY